MNMNCLLGHGKLYIDDRHAGNAPEIKVTYREHHGYYLDWSTDDISVENLELFFAGGGKKVILKYVMNPVVNEGFSFETKGCATLVPTEFDLRGIDYEDVEKSGWLMLKFRAKLSGDDPFIILPVEQE